MFNLYINERRIEDVAVLDLKGRLRSTGRVRGLHKSIRSLVEEGKPEFFSTSPKSRTLIQADSTISSRVA